MANRRFLGQDLFLEPTSITDGNASVFDARGLAKMSAIAGSGATVTWTRVDTDDASSHGTGARVVTPPAAGNLTTIDIDWPYYRVSTAGGDCVVAIV